MYRLQCVIHSEIIFFLLEVPIKVQIRYFKKDFIRFWISEF